jgi:hypothetical protein
MEKGCRKVAFLFVSHGGQVSKKSRPNGAAFALLGKSDA